MNFVSTKEDLTLGLQVVQRAVSSKNPLPILAGIKFTTGTGCLDLTATDLEIGIRCIIPAEIIEPGEIVLPSRYITELIKKLPALPVHFQSDHFSTGAVIKYGQSETIINGFPADEFPQISFESESQDLIFTSAAFKDAVRKISYAVSQEETRPVYTGILMEIGSGEVNLVATDTYRMARFTLPFDKDSSHDINLIIPGKTLNELTKIIADGETKIHLSLLGNQVLFKSGNICLISRLIDGNFPSYRKVIPTDCVSRVRIKTRDLLEATDRAALIARENAPVIKLHIDQKIISIKVSTEAGRVDEKVMASHEGEPLQVAFNARYLSDALRVIGAEDVEMEFTGPLSPAVLRPAGAVNYFSLLLPVRIQEE